MTLRAELVHDKGDPFVFGAPKIEHLSVEQPLPSKTGPGKCRAFKGN